MTDTREKKSIWKKIERFFGIMGFLAAIAALIGLYYQIKTKQIRAEFQVLSIDYLTTNNNIDGLSSNYEYKGVPVKNLWLLKFRIINNGDVTLIGKGKEINIIDSNIILHFDKKISILDNIENTQSDFPHKLGKLDSTNLSLSFEQWRKNEAAIYTLYLSSPTKEVNLYPIIGRVIIDGDFVISDQAKGKGKIKQPMLDDIVDRPLPLIGRILGVLWISFVFVVFTVFMIFSELKDWLKFVKWKKKNGKKFKEFILNDNLFKIEIPKDGGFIDGEYLSSSDYDLIENIKSDKEKYIKNPELIMSYSSVWKFYKEVPPPDNYGYVKSWVKFWFYVVLYMLVLVSSVATIFGLIIR